MDIDELLIELKKFKKKKINRVVLNGKEIELLQISYSTIAIVEKEEGV